MWPLFFSLVPRLELLLPQYPSVCRVTLPGVNDDAASQAVSQNPAWPPDDTEEHDTEEISARLHVLLGLPGCARCGSVTYGSAVQCWACLERDLGADHPELARRLRERGSFLSRWQSQGSPASTGTASTGTGTIRVFRWTRRAAPRP